jgi:hypothetical protein
MNVFKDINFKDILKILKTKIIFENYKQFLDEMGVGHHKNPYFCCARPLFLIKICSLIIIKIIKL